MIEGKIDFKSEEETRRFIMDAEERYEAQLRTVAERIAKQSPGIVTLCGPSCSGKTTTAKKLFKLLTEYGKRVHTVSFDDFYLDRTTIIKNCERRGVPVEFESVQTLDLPLLGACFKKISQGSSAFFPRYDFAKGMRSGFSRYTVHEDDMFVFEGIQALYPEVSALYTGMPHFGIYISVGEDIGMGNLVFDATTIRFLRRLVRDFKHRSSSAESTYILWESVRQNEEMNIFPYIGKADFCLSSALAYEPNVIGNDAGEIFNSVSPEQSCYPTIMLLKEKLEQLALLPESIVPTESVLWEFID